jgi:chemotaxis protein MotA
MPDALTIAGLLLAVAAVFGGSVLEGAHLGSLVQATALLIVGGGTLAAVMVQTPLSVFRRALRMVPAAFWQDAAPERQVVLRRITGWCRIARRDGLLGLDGVADTQRDPFVVNGLRLVVDGMEPDLVRRTLELELHVREDHDLEAVRVFEAAGGYAPTVGILGAVLGLIHVLENLADPESLGSGIAVAFVATVYGVGFANLVLLPIAGKLRAVTRRRVRYWEMIVDGMVAIAQNEHPRTVDSRLRSYLE